MKTLLVFAFAFGAVLAEDMMAEMKMEEAEPMQKPIAYGLPLSYSNIPLAYNTLPLAYNTLSPLTYRTAIPATTYVHQPIQTKLVEKEIEIPVKTYELEPEVTACKNSFGNPVPCAKAKRSAEDDMVVMMPAEEKAEKTMKDETAEKILPIAPYGLPLAYNVAPFTAYNTLPLSYASIPAASPVAIKTLEPKVQEIEVAKPVLKRIVEKIPVKPACQNALGWPVPCF